MLLEQLHQEHNFGTKISQICLSRLIGIGTSDTFNSLMCVCRFHGYGFTFLGEDVLSRKYKVATIKSEKYIIGITKSEKY